MGEKGFEGGEGFDFDMQPIFEITFSQAKICLNKQNKNLTPWSINIAKHSSCDFQ